MSDIDPQARFWVEARVSVAKSAVLLAAAESTLVVGDYVSTATSAYYSLFHLSLGLMWLLPESLPPKLRGDLIATRDRGDQLPAKNLPSHDAAKSFVCDGQLYLPVPKLRPLFQQARELREFVSYGPRVTYQGDQPLVGWIKTDRNGAWTPCGYTPSDVQSVVERALALMPEALKLAWPKTAYEGSLGPITVDGAVECLTDPQFPFVKWVPTAVLERAVQLIRSSR